MKSAWRQIPFLAASGQVQMALDRWLLEQHRQGKLPSVLRFYTWSPVAISLGYHQRQYPEFWHHLTWQGQPIEIIRRPTGGRAVLHQGDLTYLVITSGIPGNRIEVYEKICQFLIQGWRSLGIELHYGETQRGYIHQSNCFATATNADLIDSSGGKLIGSAQLRQGKAILQHGSIRLFPDAKLFAQVFGETPIGISSGSDKPLVVKEGIGGRVSGVVKALTQAACDCFEMDLITQPLSDSEWSEILKNV
jgi:lipoate-protein ligase A